MDYRKSKNRRKNAVNLFSNDLLQNNQINLSKSTYNNKYLNTNQASNQNNFFDKQNRAKNIEGTLSPNVEQNNLEKLVDHMVSDKA